MLPAADVREAADLLVHDPAAAAVGPQCFHVLARFFKPQDQGGPGTFVDGIVHQQFTGEGHRALGVSDGDGGFRCPCLDAGDPCGVERTLLFGPAGEELIAEQRHRRDVEGLLEQPEGLLGRGMPGLLEQVIKAVEVKVNHAAVDHVAAGDRAERAALAAARLQVPAQDADVAFERGQGLGRRLSVPQHVDQVVLGDRGPQLEQQDFQDLARLGTAQLVGSDHRPAAADPERAQDVDGQLRRCATSVFQ